MAQKAAKEVNALGDIVRSALLKNQCAVVLGGNHKTGAEQSLLIQGVYAPGTKFKYIVYAYMPKDLVSCAFTSAVCHPLQWIVLFGPLLTHPFQAYQLAISHNRTGEMRQEVKFIERMLMYRTFYLQFKTSQNLADQETCKMGMADKLQCLGK